MMAGPGRDLAIAHGSQLPAQCLLGDGDAVLLEDPLRQIDQPPTHHAVDCRDRTALDHPRDGLALRIVELRGLAARRTVIDRRQYQKPSGLPAILRPLRKTAQLRSVEVSP